MNGNNSQDISSAAAQNNSQTLLSLFRSKPAAAPAKTTCSMHRPSMTAWSKTFSASAEKIAVFWTLSNAGAPPRCPRCAGHAHSKQVLNVKKKCIYSELAGDGSRRRREMSSRFRRKSAFWYLVLNSFKLSKYKYIMDTGSFQYAV